ncbi:MAG TPA: hypothetical protein VMB05_00400 [Solirubrobacteraceae bacterium]|nr:hypothetical protein [Solirubrobacteraceae bacterium]
MSSIGDAIGRGRRKPQDPGPTPPGAPSAGGPVASAPGAGQSLAAPAAPAPGATPPPNQNSELRRRRDALAEQVTELHWDLGGLTYEMAIRDHFRLDVLVRRAAVLQERDAELAELERLLRLEDGGSVGSCPTCGAPHSRGAVYCWQCGGTLMEHGASNVAGAHVADPSTETTAAMEALLASDGPALGERGRSSLPED